MPVNNVDLPDRIFLRWQSLAEPQTYKINIKIPQWVCDEMVRPERVFCRGSKEWIDDYRDIVTLGMAPGGIVKVWVGGACLGFTEVGRFQAEIEPLGPHKNGNYRYYRAPNPAYRSHLRLLPKLPYSAVPPARRTSCCKAAWGAWARWHRRLD